MNSVRVMHLVCSNGFAGVENYIVNLASGLADDGVEVTVVGGSRDHMIPALAGVGVEWLPGDDMCGALSSLRRTRTPDILHTHMSQADLVGWLYRRSRGRVARQVSTRHFAGSRGTNAVVRAMLAPIGRSLSAQIAISHFVADHVEPPVDVVYTGVESSERTSPRERFVFAAQRLEAEKHTAEIITTWAKSQGPSAGWTLRIAGDGSERAQLEQMAHELGVGNTVEFLGHRSDVDQLLTQAGLVIAPTPREGLGIFVLEAMAHSTPVVASAGGGHLETVGAVRPDLLFAPGETDAAAEIIDRLISDPKLRAVAGASLRDLQRSRFTIRGQVEGTRAVYERTLE